MSVTELQQRSFKNWLRSLWQVLPLSWVTFKYHWLVTIASYADPEQLLEYRAAQLFGRSILRNMKMRASVEGEENLKDLEGFVVVSNHASYLDFALLLGHFPTPLRFVAKKQLKWIPGIGRHLVRCGVMIERKDRRNAVEKIAAAANDGNRVPLLIFAEGTRSDDGVPKRFKRGGLSALAEKNIPLVPVTLLNTYNYFPRGAINYRPNGDLKMIIGQPLYRKDFPTVEALVDALEGTIHQTFARHQESLDSAKSSVRLAQ